MTLYRFFIMLVLLGCSSLNPQRQIASQVADRVEFHRSIFKNSNIFTLKLCAPDCTNVSLLERDIKGTGAMSKFELEEVFDTFKKTREARVVGTLLASAIAIKLIAINLAAKVNTSGSLAEKIVMAKRQKIHHLISKLADKMGLSTSSAAIDALHHSVPYTTFVARSEVLLKSASAFRMKWFKLSNEVFNASFAGASILGLNNFFDHLVDDFVEESCTPSQYDCELEEIDRELSALEKAVNGITSATSDNSALIAHFIYNLELFRSKGEAHIVSNFPNGITANQYIGSLRDLIEDYR